MSRLRILLGSILALMCVACDSGPSFEYIHLPATEPAAGANLPFTSAINEVMNRYWGENHRPASTTVEIVRLATDPRFVLEVEAVAVLAN